MLTNREQRRIEVLNGVTAGEVTVGVSAELMGVSERHAWRLLAAYRKEGVAAIAHGNRGRKPSTTTCPDTQHRVRELAEGRYAGFNHTHLTEMMAEREGIELSRSTVRRILLTEGVRSPRRRKAPRRYSRRERYPHEGMLLPRYNEQFGVAPAQLGSAYRPLPAGVSLNETLCFKYLRTVANDNTVSFNGSTLQLLADGHRASYARALVEVQERLDGSIVVAYQGRTLAVEPAPEGPVQIRARSDGGAGSRGAGGCRTGRGRRW